MKNFMKSLVCLVMLMGCAHVEELPPVVEPRCICINGMDENCPVCYPDKDHDHDHDHNNQDDQEDNGWNYIPIPDYSPTPD